MQKANWDGYLRLKTGERFHAAISPLVNRSFVVSLTLIDADRNFEKLTKESA